MLTVVSTLMGCAEVTEGGDRQLLEDLTGFFGEDTGHVDVETTFLRIAHMLPDVGTVDVWLDGELLLTQLTFSDSSVYVALPAGEGDLVVVPAGGDLSSALVTVDALPLPDAVYSTAVIMGTASGEPAAEIHTVDDPRPETGTTLVQVIHAAAMFSDDHITIWKTDAGEHEPLDNSAAPRGASVSKTSLKVPDR